MLAWYDVIIDARYFWILTHPVSFNTYYIQWVEHLLKSLYTKRESVTYTNYCRNHSKISQSKFKFCNSESQLMTNSWSLFIPESSLLYNSYWKPCVTILTIVNVAESNITNFSVVWILGLSWNSCHFEQIVSSISDGSRSIMNYTYIWYFICSDCLNQVQTQIMLPTLIMSSCILFFCCQQQWSVDRVLVLWRHRQWSVDGGLAGFLAR